MLHLGSLWKAGMHGKGGPCSVLLASGASSCLHLEAPIHFRVWRVSLFLV